MNKALILGNLGKDPELRYTKTGDPVCTFNVATSQKWKDKAGKAQEKTEWHRIVVWKKLAELCGQYLHKGATVLVEGEINYRSYEKEDGQKQYITEIKAMTVRFIKTDKQHTEADQGGEEVPPPAAVDDNLPF